MIFSFSPQVPILYWRLSTEQEKQKFMRHQNVMKKWDVTVGLKLTKLNLFQTILWPMFPEEARNRRHVNTCEEEELETLGFNLSFAHWPWTFPCFIYYFTFPCFKEPINGQTWLLQNDDSISDESISMWLLPKH